MELLEGETLAARLARGALPIAHALQIAIQIVSALDTAHRAGIVHRDLKPGNVFLVRSGGPSALPTAKLLDFGLAKAMRPPVATNSTTMTASPGVTASGSIVGTIQYMAPEQIAGKQVDGRTDIFAFGTVLFEMLTARKAFEAESNAGVMAAILEREPRPLSSLERAARPRSIGSSESVWRKIPTIAGRPLVISCVSCGGLLSKVSRRAHRAKSRPAHACDTRPAWVYQR